MIDNIKIKNAPMGIAVFVENSYTSLVRGEIVILVNVKHILLIL